MLQLWSVLLFLSVHLWGQSVSPPSRQEEIAIGLPVALSFHDWANTVPSPSPPTLQLLNWLWWVNMGLALGSLCCSRQHVYRKNSFLGCIPWIPQDWFLFSCQLTLISFLFQPFCMASPKQQHFQVLAWSMMSHQDVCVIVGKRKKAIVNS